MLRLLLAYGLESWHKEPDRVKRDLVILSRGSIPKLRAGIELACVDYRDVLVGEEVDPWGISELKNPPANA